MHNTMNILAGKTAKPPKLTPQRQRFADAFLTGQNNTQAAVTAGYALRSAYNQGDRLMKHDEVKAYIAFYQMQIAERNKITQDEIVEGIRAVITRVKDASARLKDGSQVASAMPLLKGYELLAKMGGYLRDQGTDPELRPAFIGINITMGNGKVEMTRTNSAQSAHNKQIAPQSKP